jgi:hypothetical protein
MINKYTKLSTTILFRLERGSKAVMAHIRLKKLGFESSELVGGNSE